MTTYIDSSERKIKLRRGKRAAIAVASAALLLAGCGGSDDGPDPYEARGEPIAVAAGSSAAAYVSYIAGLTNSDTDEPLDLKGFTAPTDDATDL